MTIELTKRIEQWEKDAVYNTRQVKIVKRLSNGEYILLLLEGANLDIEGQITTVKSHKLFQTMGQTTANQSKLRGDLYIFDKLANLVAEDYLNRSSETIGQWMEENIE